jgi:hypothetical protein
LIPATAEAKWQKLGKYYYQIGLIQTQPSPPCSSSFIIYLRTTTAIYGTTPDTILERRTRRPRKHHGDEKEQIELCVRSLLSRFLEPGEVYTLYENALPFAHRDRSIAVPKVLQGGICVRNMLPSYVP